jgi:type II secretory ATPase GspE/PulE/Tfp pilus assembly ATPase PilB-like protein
MTLQEQAKSEAVLGAEESAVKELTNKIIQAAVVDKASDIHIDPALKETKIRFRIDGVMHEVVAVPRDVHDPLVTRFKIMADLDTANRRSIQNGRVHITHEGHEYHLLECALPSVHGEKLVVRILDAEHALVRLDQVGYRESDRKRLDECLRSPMGLIIFTGPSGCGKTTVMYGAMGQLSSPEVTLYSIEEPVELLLPGVVQMPVNRKAGLGFAEILRGLMRGDPDIIMVGDVRDLETAELCFQAAITGHLVLTTLHALDAAGTVQRLWDMGVEPFIMSSALLMVSAQRLVRRVCTECKQEAKYLPELVAEWRKRAEAGGLTWPDEQPKFYKGKGCDRCRKTGYYGRTGIFETLVMYGEMPNLVSTRADISEIREAAIKNGMTTMLADGMAKAMEGQTTVEEVLRVLGG